MEPLKPGDVLAERFSIEAPLGHGVLGEVYRAKQLAMGRSVAVKILHAASLRSEHAHRRFEQEAVLLGRLAHPNIVQVFDFGIDEVTQRPFIALELIAGSTLLARLRNEGPMSEAEAARVCEQIALALTHAHGQGIVHRDLKPANVMLSDLADGRAPLVKVLDFGLGKLLQREEAKARLTAPGQMLGTPSFASPEQALGDDVDERSDLYALGCLAFALVAGRAPHAAADPAEALRMKRSEGPPPLPAVLTGGAPPSPELDALYRHLLERRPADRPGTAREVARRFAEIAEDAEQRTAAMPIPEAPTDVPVRVVPVALTDPTASIDTAPSPDPYDHRDTVARIDPSALADSAVRTDPYAPSQPSLHPDTLPDTTPSVDRLGLSRPVEAPIAEPSTVAGGRLPLFLAATAAIVAVAALLAARTPKTEEVPSAPVETSAAPRVQVAPRPLHRVRVESTPPGARVVDGDQSLGDTPLDLALAPDRLPRALRVVLAEHRPETIEIREDGPATVLVELSPLPPVRAPRAAPGPKRPRDGGAYPVW